MPQNVILYTRRDSPRSDEARKRYSKKNVLFEERAVEKNPRWADEAFNLSGQPGYPVIVEDGRVLVGVDGQTD